MIPGAVAPKEHHVHPEDIATEARKITPSTCTDLPKYTVIREPYEQVRSLFYHVKVNNQRNVSGYAHWDPTPQDMIEWLEKWRKNTAIWWAYPSIYPYKNVADEIFIYDHDLQLVVDAMCDTAGITDRPTVGWVGKSDRIPHGLLTAEVREAINEFYGEDVEYYYDLLDS